VHHVAISWLTGDGIDHSALALAAAHRALEIDPELSMAYAVIGMEHETTGEGYVGAIKNLDTAIDKDPKNATAWLWRGITFKDMGYFEKAVADFEQCLSLDPGYLICSQYLATSQLAMGQIEAAVKQFESTFENNFHSTDEAFVSYYVNSGQRNMALLIAALGVRRQFAPVKDWIEAIENPLSDHTARVERFNQWGAAYNITVCDMNEVAVAFRQEDCFASVSNANMNWHPDAAYYRKKPAFKEFVNANFMDYWKQNGFPPQCRSLGDDDFECD